MLDFKKKKSRQDNYPQPLGWFNLVNLPPINNQTISEYYVTNKTYDNLQKKQNQDWFEQETVLNKLKILNIKKQIIFLQIQKEEYQKQMIIQKEQTEQFIRFKKEQIKKKACLNQNKLKEINLKKLKLLNLEYICTTEKICFLLDEGIGQKENSRDEEILFYQHYSSIFNKKVNPLHLFQKEKKGFVIPEQNELLKSKNPNSESKTSDLSSPSQNQLQISQHSNQNENSNKLSIGKKTNSEIKYLDLSSPSQNQLQISQHSNQNENANFVISEQNELLISKKPNPWVKKENKQIISDKKQQIDLLFSNQSNNPMNPQSVHLNLELKKTQLQQNPEKINLQEQSTKNFKKAQFIRSKQEVLRSKRPSTPPSNRSNTPRNTPRNTRKDLLPSIPRK